MNNLTSPRKFQVLISIFVLGAGLVASSAHASNNWASGNSHQKVCADIGIETANCNSLVVLVDGTTTPFTSTSPTGQTPESIKNAYNYPTSPTAGAGKTIAIVAAFDDPTAEADLGTFSGQFGLPSCTSTNGCFLKVSQTGSTRYPKSDARWALEISLDIQWAHAIAPGAKILLVEAKSSSLKDLVIAENYAKINSDYVSNSWGLSEFPKESDYDSNFIQAGVSFFFASGDSGLPATYPSSSPNIVSVGGTSLHFVNGEFNSESGWLKGGGGCSLYEPAGSAQAHFDGYNCAGFRSTPDVALDADPVSGVSVFDSTPYITASGVSLTGWFQVGGTSASAPMVAARAAITGSVFDAATIYSDAITFRDITTGGNSGGCLVGFDLCSGRGSWIG
jgi:subtilase family serine protease